MDRNLAKMVEAELCLELREYDADEDLDTYDAAEVFLASNPELSEPTRKYLMWRGMAAFLDSQIDDAADAIGSR